MLRAATWCALTATLMTGTDALAEVTVLRLALLDRGSIDMPSDRFVLAEDGGQPQELRGALDVAVYEVVARFSGGEPTAAWEGQMLRFELRATEARVTRRWRLWSREPLGYFQLVIDPVSRRRSYLAWVRGNELFFSLIAAANPELVSLEAAIRDRRPAHVFRVPIAGMHLPHSVFGTRRSALHVPIRVGGIHQEEGGGWVVTLGGPPGATDAVSLVSPDGKTWQQR
ncbi:MAG: hypothetical protein AB7Y46_17870 [Armatimonadota bacterium]